MLRSNQRLVAVLLSVSLLVVFPGATASAASTAADPVAVLQRMFDAQNSKDLNGVLTVLSDDFQQDGGACNVHFEPTHCDSKAAFVKAFGPPDTWPTLRFAGTPQVNGDTVSGSIDARFASLPELFHALSLDHALGKVSARVRGDQLYYVRFDIDTTDPQTGSFIGLLKVPPARDGRTIFDERPATQDMFAGTWGTKSSQRWATEHDAELQRSGG